MTLSDLLAASYADLGYESSPSAGVTTRLTRYCNEGYRLILSMDEFTPLRSNTVTFASVANQKSYGLPQALVAIDQMVNTTQNVRVRLMTQDVFRTMDPQETSTGTPTHYVPLGYGPVQAEPGTTGVWAVSSAAGDTTQTASVLGVRTGGIPTTLQTGTLSGITRVAIGSFTDYVAIQQFELSATAVGLVTLYDAATLGNILAQIPIGQKSVQYQTIRLWPTPSAADTYAIDGVLNLTDLAQTYDIPLIPSDFQYVLSDFVRMREYEYRDDSRAPMAAAMYQQKLKLMRDRVMNPPDYRPRVGRLPDRGNNLNGYYPVGRF